MSSVMNALASPVPRTLIADDQPNILTALRLLLKGAGFETEAVTSPAAVLEALKRCDFDLVLIDLNYARDTTSGQEGLDLISRIRAFDSSLPVVVLTAWGSVELAVEAMQRGVRHFVQKPWENARLLNTVRTQIELGRQRRKQKKMVVESLLLRRRLQHELSEAREIQRALLPKEIPSVEGIEIAAAWQTARAVGGDYFDVLKFDDTHAGICIADVSGKGMPAALLMSNLQAVLKSCAARNVTPREVCREVNRTMCGNMASHQFITFFYGLLDTQAKTLTYTNAGHPPPMLVHNSSSQRLETGGPVLGVFPESQYQQGEIELHTDDCLLMFTDGITEECDARGEEFGEERLLRLLVDNHGFGAAELREKIMAHLTEFSSGNIHDDATLMVLRAEQPMVAQPSLVQSSNNNGSIGQ
jgi:phosphoserine phosphatase RsbU/P